MDPRKIEVVVQWEPPTNVSELQNFLGMAGYYRWFVEGFSKIAMPLTKLLRKGSTYSWDKKCQDSFEELKTRLATASLLTLPTSGGV